ncbi:MAG: hypothetical protein D6772_16460, partial [Bacteroidetes bacterium]
WYGLTLKVQARNESVMVSIHDLPAVIASLGVGIFPNAKATLVLTAASGYLLTTPAKVPRTAGSLCRAWVRPNLLRRQYNSLPLTVTT